MKNSDVINAFLRRESAKTTNMRTDGEKLFSYGTVVAQRINGGVFVNATKYSRTTSKQTSALVRHADEDKLVYFVPVGTTDLTPYLNPNKDKFSEGCVYIYDDKARRPRIIEFKVVSIINNYGCDVEIIRDTAKSLDVGHRLRACFSGELLHKSVLKDGNLIWE